jgi:hypothetical protein
MAFTDAEQAEMMAELSTHSAMVDFVPISVEFSQESEPIQFSDGSYEMGKPYCVAKGKDVTDNAIKHGTALVMASTTWYVIGVQEKRTGFYHLTLSKTA